MRLPFRVKAKIRSGKVGPEIHDWVELVILRRRLDELMLVVALLKMCDNDERMCDCSSEDIRQFQADSFSYHTHLPFDSKVATLPSIKMHRTIDEIAASFATLEGVEALVLAGSTTSGLADEESDYDLY
jgi:hypothetical protein